VTVVEFSDFRCPYCRRAQPALAKLLARHPESVRLAFKHFPVVSPDSGRAAVAAVVAGWQGRFWEMHDALFALQGRPLSEDAVLAIAEDLGLDVERFRSDLRDPDALAVVEADARSARRLGLRGTPAFVIDGRLLRGAQPYERFEQVVAEALADTR